MHSRLLSKKVKLLQEKKQQIQNQTPTKTEKIKEG